MSQFYAEIKGCRGISTRTGSKGSGIKGHIRGWDIGCRVVMAHVNGKDVCSIYKTTGSSNKESDTLIAEFTE